MHIAFFPAVDQGLFHDSRKQIALPGLFRVGDQHDAEGFIQVVAGGGQSGRTGGGRRLGRFREAGADIIIFHRFIKILQPSALLLHLGFQAVFLPLQSLEFLFGLGQFAQAAEHVIDVLDLERPFQLIDHLLVVRIDLQDLTVVLDRHIQLVGIERFFRFFPVVGQDGALHFPGRSKLGIQL